MGTRGLIGFSYQATDKFAYNHYNSDPAYLGVRILEELRGVNNWEQVAKYAANLHCIPEERLLNENSAMDVAQVRRHLPDEQQATNPRDYYELMRPLQGTLTPYLNGSIGFMATANEFIYDGLHCEWAYIVNLDLRHFEIWKGSRLSPSSRPERHEQIRGINGYYPCQRLKTYDLDKLPEPTTFLSEIYSENLEQE